MGTATAKRFTPFIERRLVFALVLLEWSQDNSAANPMALLEATQ
jgi:hypothetical protein